MAGAMFEIAGHRIGSREPCFVIGEVAQTHDGSLGMAHAFVDAIARAGADAVKFQTHIAEAESTSEEQWRVKFSLQDRTRYDYWKRMEFTQKQWQELKSHAEERGLVFLSSPFSLEAVALLASIGIRAWKIPSGEVSNVAMLERISRTRLPVILSSGMSPWQEIDAAVELLKGAEVPFAVLQCTSEYPCPPERVGLNLIGALRERYQCPVGLSDHSGAIYTGLAAVTLGSNILEVHVTLSGEMFGPDVPASVATGELRQLVEGVRFIEKMMAQPLDKDEMAQQASEMRRLFTKSLVARRDLVAGTTLGSEDLATKKPGTGIPAARLQEFVGRKLLRNVRRDQLLEEEDFELVSAGPGGSRK